MYEVPLSRAGSVWDISINGYVVWGKKKKPALRNIELGNAVHLITERLMNVQPLLHKIADTY